MELSLREKAIGFMISPEKTFNRVIEEDFVESVKYFLVLDLIFSLLLTMITVAFLSWVPSIGFLGFVIFFVFFTGAILGQLIFGIWTHIWIYILGGRQGIDETLKAVFYGYTPTLLIGWTIIGLFIGGMWSMLSQITGIATLQKISTGKALLGYIVSMGMIFMIVYGIFFIFMSVIIMTAGPAMMNSGNTFPLESALQL